MSDKLYNHITKMSRLTDIERAQYIYNMDILDVIELKNHLIKKLTTVQNILIFNLLEYCNGSIANHRSEIINKIIDK